MKGDDALKYQRETSEFLYVCKLNLKFKAKENIMCLLMAIAIVNKLSGTHHL